MFFLFADLYLGFSRFMSKAGHETPVRWYIVELEVSAFSVLFHGDRECIQFFYSVVCAKKELIDDPLQCNAYDLLPEKTVFFFLDVKNFPDLFQTLPGIQISSASGCGRQAL